MLPGEACRLRAPPLLGGLPPARLPSPVRAPPQAHLAHIFVDGTVYYCPECEARYFGVERCLACDRICRPLGIGGICPCCDAPVAIQDLMG